MGVHTYARGGQSYPISVAILDAAGRTTIAAATAQVAQAPLAAAAASLAAVEGAVVPAGTTLASFSDTGGADPLSAYAATVAWGDGTTNTATVQQSGADFRVVSAAAHTYAEEGSDTVLVTITERNAAGAVITTAYAAGAAAVSDAALAAVAAPGLAVAKGTPLVGAKVASFTDANPAAAVGDFAATIDWGDGSPPSPGTIAQPGGAGTAFVVRGSHTYAAAGPYTITVSVRDRDGATLVATSQASVADVAPLVSGIPVPMTKGIFFALPVAYIVEVTGAAPEPAGHYTATITWGDGTTATAGTIEAIPGGAWVVGSHTYAGAGPYTITVTVHDNDGFTVSATTTAFDPPGANVPAGPRHHGRHGARQFHRPAGHRKPGFGHIQSHTGPGTMVETRRTGFR